MAAIQPTSIDQLAQILAEGTALRLVGTGSQSAWRVPTECEAPTISLQRLDGMIDFSPADQVVSVRAGTRLTDLQTILAEQGQCLPYCSDLLSSDCTIGGLISLNLPHGLEGECGSWRDWVLGITVVLADGTVAKSGSHAVKNVAGYDVHKLFIGARGTLGAIADVILRTYPLASLPKVNRIGGAPPEHPIWCQRLLRSDFTEAEQASRSFEGFAYPNSSLITCRVPEDVELKRFPGDAVWRSKCGAHNLRITDPTVVRLMKRTKEIFDPTAKLNPGEMGIF